MIGSLKDVFRDDDIACGDPLYLLDEIKAIYPEVIKIDQCYIALNEKEHWLDFALFQFSMSDGDGTNERVSLIFHGSGTTGSLREARHIYWGPNSEGYTFYLPGKTVIKALTYLQKYFDFD